MSCKLKNYVSSKQKLGNNAVSSPSRNWYYANEIKTIYNIPKPNITTKKNVAVVSFGGGLYGNLSMGGELTYSDCHKYWKSIGMTEMPTIMIKTIGNTTNSPNENDGATLENTIDIQQIGACCPSSNLNIILYIAENDINNFPLVLNTILNDTIHPPSVISISWGAPEIYFPQDLLTTINNIFATAVSKGINVVVASGDNGSNDGVGGASVNADFPASSPNVVACGGTKLICKNGNYDNKTIETAWSNGGGAASNFFNKPDYQSNINGNYRVVPDISMNAAPSTGVSYNLNNKKYIVGGTSIVAPTMAGFIVASGINKFINNTMYLSNNCFHDIISGNNGANHAKIGYDACTGLGSIIGNNLATFINNYVPTSSLTLNKTSINLKMRTSRNTVSLAVNQVQLIGTVSPANATYRTIKWSSSNNTIATVSSTGLITAKKVGTVVISASINGLKSDCSVTIV